MPFVVWITGLPCSGKTTLGTRLSQRLNAVLLDGDAFRRTMSHDLGFTAQDREENLRRASYTAKFLRDAGQNVVCCFITPYESIRRDITAMLGHVVWVYTSCPLQVCMERDVKGMYAQAVQGRIPYFTGVSSRYEAPSHPDVRVETAQMTPDACVHQVLTHLETKGLWKVKATLMIGRFSPPHKGHQYVFDAVLQNGGKLVIAIRDTPLTAKDPYTAQQRQMLLTTLYRDNPHVTVMILPDIDTVSVGRDVGYQIMEVPEHIERISASYIRAHHAYEDIPEAIVELVKTYDTQNQVDYPYVTKP